MISRNILSRIGPLSIAHGGNSKHSQAQCPAALQQVLHKPSLADILTGTYRIGNRDDAPIWIVTGFCHAQKKDGTNG